MIVAKNKLRIPSWRIDLETAQELTGNETHVGVRAYHLREALPNEMQNCFLCKVKRTQSEPFRIHEHLLPLIETNAETNTEELFPLIRFASNAEGTLVIEEQTETIRRFHIPPDCVMPLV
jgi:hypothetical protein